MTRAGQLARGLVALVLLTACVAGLPWALWHFIGWPLPHQLPTTAQLTRALQQQGIADRTLIDALAVVVWVAWASLAAALAAELPAVAAGRRARRLPVASAFQPLVARLLAAITVAFLATAPRPTPAVGTLGATLGANQARPPAVTLLAELAGIQTALAPAPPPAATPPSATPSPATPLLAPDAAPAGRTYVVQRGDTLWSIAERELGDPLRWSTLYQLNAGRTQPGGATLTDPHWIDPGWTLLLPASVIPTPAPAARGALTPAAPPRPRRAASPPAAPPPATPPLADQSPATTPAAASPAPPAPAAANPAPPQVSSAPAPVQLPSGSSVAGSFAAGILATVALGRLRRRHTYRYHPPRPGRDLSPAPLRPTVGHLARVAQGDEPANGPLPDHPVPDLGVAFAVDEQRRLDPGQLDIGVRDGAPVAVDVAELGGLALAGPGVDDVARALAAALLVRAGPGAAEVLCTCEVAARLLPGAETTALGLRQLADGDELARVLHAERIARMRRLSGAQALDAARFRQDNPEQPLPLLLVLADPPATHAAGQWAALLTGAASLGVAVVFLGESPPSLGRLTLDAHATVTAACPTTLEARVLGARLHRLGAAEAVELLAAVADANQPPAGDDEETTWTFASAGETGQRNGVTDVPLGAEPWPEPERHGTHPPIEVQLLGPYRISFHGKPVSTGLRARARLLLAWSLLRPEGATVEQVVDTLWPDTPPERVARQFWYALGDLRTYFRDHDTGALDVLEKLGEHYRPNPAEITCDVWEFQAALGHAARAGDDDAARTGLRRAVEAYRGDLVAGADYPWLEVTRCDLHRRALDAHLRLAELDEHAGQPDAAVDTLERVIELDCYAEEPYRRLMALHARRARPDAVTATWRLLRRHLAELDLEVEEATVRLYRKLTAEPNQGAPRQVRQRTGLGTS